MPSTQQFVIGSEVRCSDGARGELLRVVLDPVANELTHIVVGLDDSSRPRLVPVDLVATNGEPLVLSCTRPELASLEAAEETKLLPGPSSLWGYGEGQMATFPYFGLGMGMAQMSMAGAGATVYDRVPLGEVEVRRGSPVEASDGPVGRVLGLVVDPADRHVTHVLLEEGHLWAKKEVAVPISSIRSAHGHVQVDLTRQEVRELPPLDIHKTAPAGPP